MTDQQIIEALIARDERVTQQFFFRNCRPLFLSIIRYIFSYDVDYDEFVNDGKINKRWALNTTKKWTTLRNHLKAFNENLRYEDITDKMLSAYVLYCAKDLCMLDSSIQKELGLVRWFLKWAQQKGYHNNGAYEKFRARFKESKRPIIFLNKDEVMKVFRFQIPENGTEITLHDIDGNEYKKIVSEIPGYRPGL